jgi:hypothetical protein
MALVVRTAATATAGTQARNFEKVEIFVIDVSSLDSTVIC